MCHDELIGGGFPATLRAYQLYGQLDAPHRGAIQISELSRETKSAKSNGIMRQVTGGARKTERKTFTDIRMQFNS